MEPYVVTVAITLDSTNWVSPSVAPAIASRLLTSSMIVAGRHPTVLMIALADGWSTPARTECIRCRRRLDRKCSTLPK